MLFSQVDIPFYMFTFFALIAILFLLSGGQLWSNYNFKYSNGGKDNECNMSQCRVYIVIAIVVTIAFDALGISLIISEGIQIFNRILFLTMITTFVGTTSRALWLITKRKKVSTRNWYIIASLIEISIFVCTQALSF